MDWHFLKVSKLVNYFILKNSAGLLRSKNTQSIVVQIISGMVILGVLWDIFGYSLTFGKDHSGIIGDLNNAFLLNVDRNECSKFAPHIPSNLYALFMMMFAAITPLLMSGLEIF